MANRRLVTGQRLAWLALCSLPAVGCSDVEDELQPAEGLVDGSGEPLPPDASLETGSDAPGPDAADASTTDAGPVKYTLVVGAEEVASATTGLVRPSIALDPSGMPHIVADRGIIGQQPMQLYIFHKQASGWTEALFAESCSSSCLPPKTFFASRIQLGHLEIDSKGRGWVSAWFGTKEFGDLLGQGVWLVEDISTSPAQKWLGMANDENSYKNGNVSIDRADPDRAIVMTKFGHWEELSPAGPTSKEGQLDLGNNGEKMRFLIRSRPNGKPGVWHVAGSGWSQEHANYRSSLIDGPVAWASNQKYEMGDDMLHPGLGLDGKSPAMAYMAIKYGADVVYNVWNGSGMVFPADALPVIETSAAKDGNGETRFAPQWAPAPGPGAFICWTRSNNRIYVRHVSPTGELGKPVNVTAGSNCSMTLGADGAIHMAYASGGLRYRRIEVLPH